MGSDSGAAGPVDDGSAGAGVAAGSGADEAVLPLDGTPQQVRLQSLAPRYDPGQHELYVVALEQAIKGNDRLAFGEAEVRNIALTGPYGVGKSSVLLEVGRRLAGRTIELSLSSVGRGGPGTSGAAESGEGGEVRAESVTDRIQKEIVKQILYRDAPSRTRASRFRRLSKLPRGRVLAVGLGAATLLLAVLYLTGWSRPLVASAAGGSAPLSMAVAYLTLWLLLVAAALLVQWAGHGRLSLEKLTAGPATVTLSGERGSYFDQFVDEIVYYFEQTGRNVVILEDLDRFDDVHIFESLRALNTLLNSAEQVRGRAPRKQARKARSNRDRKGHGDVGEGATRGYGRRPPVVFIYALRDSVFERIEEGTSSTTDEEVRQERERANRTKFFDLIVPVVPFVSRRNAGDLLRELMGDRPVSDRLISVAGQHVADQRLLIDLRNEYDVYADRLLFGEKVLPGLTADKVFAMLLFKAVHLADFERIRFGRSRLDRLWEQWRALVAAGLDRAAAQQRDAEDALDRDSTTRSHARVLADRVDELAMAVLAAPSRTAYEVQTAGGPREPSDRLREPDFWRTVVQQRAALSVLYGWNGSETWAFPSLATRLDRPLQVAAWAPVNEARQRRRLEAAAADLTFLTHHGWQELFDRPRFTLPSPGEGAAGRSFAELVDALQSPLTRDLIADGFIDEYFGLYVSMFYGRLISVAAQDFTVRALDRGRADLDHRLEPADVAAILDDRGVEVLRDRASYNVTALDYLLAVAHPGLNVLVRQLTSWTEQDVAFVTRYLQLGMHPAALVKELAPLRANLPGFLLQVAVTEQQRAILIDAALLTAETDGDAEDDRLRQYVVENYRQFPSMTTQAEAAEPTAADALPSLDVRLPEVAELNAPARHSLASSGAYTITASNLEAVSGGRALALDLLTRAPSVRETVLGRLSEYLAAIGGSAAQVTVSSPEAFVPVLVEVLDRTTDAGLLTAVVAGAAPDCVVEELTAAPTAVWAPLLSEGRTPPSAKNLLAFVERFRGLEQVASALVDVRQMDGVEGLALQDRRLLAVAVLDTSLPVAHRVALISGLRPGVLTVEDVTAQAGPLIGMLLTAGLLEDAAVTFEQLVPDWASREPAIAASRGFVDFVDVDVLPGTELAQFFRSSQVEPAKPSVLERLADWEGEVDSDAAEAAASWAVRTAQTPAIAAVETMIDAGAPVRLCVVLLSRLTMPAGTLQALLRKLGGDYAAVAGRGTRPLLLPDDAAHRAILQQLREAREIGQVKPEAGGLRVWLRKPAG